MTHVNSRIDRLKLRANELERARSFFKARGVIEVDTPHLSSSVIVDSYIDLIPALFRGTHTCYLNSSPEMYMKQLLAEGMGDIYQLGHVFRDGELGQRHNPEFTMCEWYRIGFSYDQMIEETVSFIKHIIGDYPVKKISYREAFLNTLNLDPFNCTFDQLVKVLVDHDIDPMKTDDQDELISQVLVELVEPHFKIPSYTVLTHFPTTMASLARIVNHEGYPVAERFEIYFHGLELANGFCELTESGEQLSRFEFENKKRGESNKPPLPISLEFIDCLNKMPACSGVAVGFDRLLMLKFKANSISEVLPFPF